MANKFWIGPFIAMIVLSTSFYFVFYDDEGDPQLKFQLQKTRNLVSIYNGSAFIPVAYEYILLFDGRTKMLAKSRTLDYINGTPPTYTDKIINYTETINYTGYSVNITSFKNITVYVPSISTIVNKIAIMFRDNITIKEVYEFDGYSDDISKVPLSREVCFTNAKGKIFEYRIADLDNTFDYRINITSPFEFGRNMKIEFQDGYYLARYYNWKTVSNKIRIKYKIPTDDECYSVRLFDPPIEYNYLNGSYYGSTIDNVANITIQVDSGCNFDYCSDEGNLGKWIANYGVVAPSSRPITDMIDGFAPPEFENNAYFVMGVLEPDLPCIYNITIDLGNSTNLNYTINKTIIGYVNGVQNAGGAIIEVFSSSTSQHFPDASLITGTWESITTLTILNKGGGTAFDYHQINWSNVNTRYLRFSVTPVYAGTGIVYSQISEIQVFGTPYLVTPKNLNLNLTGLNQSRIYEYETTVELATDYTSIDVLDNTGRYIGETSPFNYYIDLLRVNQFNDTTLNKTISNGTVSINFSSKKELYNASINLTSFPITANTTNVSLDVNKDGIKDFEVIGEIINQDYYVNWFNYLGSSYLRKNLTFLTAGEQTFYLNLSTSSPGAEGNISFTLTGFDIDSGNELDFNFWFNATDKLNNTINITVNISSPLGIYENFEVNVSFNDWDSEIVAGGCGVHVAEFSDGEDDDYVRVRGSGLCKSYIRGTSTSSAKIYNTVLDLRKNSMIKVRWLSSSSPPGGISGSSLINFYDGVTSVLIKAVGYSAPTWLGNITLIRTSPTSNIWKRYEDGVVTGTVSTAGLDPDKKLTIQLFESANSVTGSDYTIEVTSTLYIIELGGIYLNKTRTGIGYDTNGTWESGVVLQAQKDIIAAWLFVNDTKPPSTNIDYFLSGDNGTTWTPTTPGFRTPLTLVDAEDMLRVKVNMTTNNINYTPSVQSMNVKVIPVALANVTVSIGGIEVLHINGTFDYPYTYSNSAFFLTNYLNEENCGTQIMCAIPIAIKSEKAGEIQVSGINITKGFNPINFNVSSIQDLDIIVINITSQHGNLTVNDLRFDYRGDKNITVLAHSSDYTINMSWNITVRYSKFNVTIIPPSIDEWSLAGNLYSYTQYNIPPFGNPDQNGNPFFNVSQLTWHHPIDIYVRYNESVNTCQNTTFLGTNRTTNNTFNVVLNETEKLLISNFTTGVTGPNQINISTLTNVSCSAQNSTLLFPYFCFFSICTECVYTSDWADNCELIR